MASLSWLWEQVLWHIGRVLVLSASKEEVSYWVQSQYVKEELCYEERREAGQRMQQESEKSWEAKLRKEKNSKAKRLKKNSTIVLKGTNRDGRETFHKT